MSYMKNSRLIIFSGGHTTCFETIKYVKPSICIPTQPEQRANAKKMQDMKCSIIAENRTQLVQAIREMEKKIEFYKFNVQKLNQYSNKFKGIEKTVEIIEEAVPIFNHYTERRVFLLISPFGFSSSKIIA
jgi:UDP-N-acetylglucosamine:LPS N-acetylglucosamine transferase